jgi:hypothetical protein
MSGVKIGLKIKINLCDWDGRSNLIAMQGCKHDYEMATLSLAMAKCTKKQKPSHKGSAV